MNKELLRDRRVIAGAAALGGLVVGAVGGYFAAKKKVTERAMAEIEVLTEEMKLQIDLAMGQAEKIKDKAVEDVVKATIRADKAKRDTELKAKGLLKETIVAAAEVIDDAEEEIEEEDEVGKYVDPYDFETEAPLRMITVPYIITVDEFFGSDEEDYNKLSIDYWAGDRVLSDDKEEHIPDVEGTVTEANLERFGHGSNDPNLVYVRNDRLQTDFEICYNPGSYSREVLGMLEHANEYKRKPRKFRQDED